MNRALVYALAVAALSACGASSKAAPTQREFGDIWATHQRAEPSGAVTYLSVSEPQHVANCWAAVVTDTDKYENVVFERDGKVVDVFTAGTSMQDADILKRAGCM